MTDYNGNLTAADLDGLPDLVFEVRDGNLVIGGTSHGHGPHARVLLQLLKTPPEPLTANPKAHMPPG